MLVLSRRQTEKIVFPSINTTIEILKIRGNVARIGIQAPQNLPIVRGELLVNGEAPKAPEPTAETAAVDKSDKHRMRNHLNVATVGLNLIRRQLDAGMVQEARQTAASVLNRFAEVFPEPTMPPARAERAVRALLVEDDANERQLLASLLRTFGIEVDTASDGSEAIDYLAHHNQPDVVLMDMLMPRCDGPTAVRTIRRDMHLDGLKIFAVSGTSPSVLGLETGPAGIDRWFAKPLDPERLLGELHQTLLAPCHTS